MHRRPETGGWRYRHSETAQRVIDTALQSFGRVDLLVNNAGVFNPEAVYRIYRGRLPASGWNEPGRILLRLSARSGKNASFRKSGHVVNISTSFVSQPIGVLPASLANLTKSGLSRSLVRCIEFADEGYPFQRDSLLAS